MTYQPGEILLEEYRIEALIGQGAFGEVYRVINLGLKVPRALKILRRDSPGMGSTSFNDGQARFQLEAQLGAQLNTPTPHPNLLQVHRFKAVGDLLVLEMEYAPGGSLLERIQAARLKGAALPVEEVMQIALGIALGLALLHNRDVVHRDLKPSNLLFDDQNRIKFADFGLAQVPGGPSMRSQLSNAQPHPGTPEYMSPEQESTPKHLTPASDIYAFGLVLFEMLTNRTYKNVRLGTRARTLRSETLEWLDDLLATMLSENPRERPVDGNEVADLLRAPLQQQEAKQKAEQVAREAIEHARLEEQNQAAEHDKATREAAENAVREKETREKAESQAVETLILPLMKKEKEPKKARSFINRYIIAIIGVAAIIITIVLGGILSQLTSVSTATATPVMKLYSPTFNPTLIDIPLSISTIYPTSTPTAISTIHPTNTPTITSTIHPIVTPTQSLAVLIVNNRSSKKLSVTVDGRYSIYIEKVQSATMRIPFGKHTVSVCIENTFYKGGCSNQEINIDKSPFVITWD